jgi:DNA modification methylase
MKPYYEDAKAGIVIYNADCREVLPQLEIPDAALFIVDPPYGISHSSNQGASWERTTIANDDSTELRDWIIGFADGNPMLCFGSWKASRPSCRAVLVWDKGPAFGMGDLSFPWKPSWEEIYVRGEGFCGRRDEGVIRGFSCVTWESKGRKHPHEKPPALLAYLMSKHPSGMIVDPTMGSGSALRAAKDIGRKAIGIELEREYCDKAIDRLRQEVLF